MERKDYAEKFRDIKDEILDEIRSILEYGVKHNFKETFYIHYSDGEVFNTEECAAVEVNDCGGVSFHIIDCDHESDVMGGDLVFAYDPNSFLDILDHLKKDIREEKLAILRDIVKKNEGSVDFDGTFDITIHNTGEDFICKLTALRITKNGKLEVDNTFHGLKCTNPEYEISDKDLDKLIAYVRKNTYRKFVIRVSGSFSRTFDINASSYEEALALAKQSWEITPLYFEDSNGENWEDYTSQAV